MSIASMTGFARSQGAFAGLGWTFEFRSVNGRGLDVRFRLPAPFDILEADLRARLQKRLARGAVQVSLTARRDPGATGQRVNDAAFAAYAEAAERLAWSAKLAAATVGDLLRLPGVIDQGEGGDAALGEEAQAAAVASFEEGLGLLEQARRGEGEALARIVSGLLDDIDWRVRDAGTADSARQSAIRARLKAQVEALMDTSAALDPDRLHQEAVLIASRVDVREEIDRLKAHVEQARGHLAGAGPVGRKLDFLAQEFVRESNTLCSKANDIALTRIGLDLKAIVEQFREQVQNIE